LTTEINDEYIAYIFNEVVRLNEYDLIPMTGEYDVIYDIGANVGMFTMQAAVLNPDVRAIFSVEPDAANYAYLELLKKHIPNLTTINAALGRGSQFFDDSVPPGNRIYRCSQIGYPDNWRDSHALYKEARVDSMMFDEIYERGGGSNAFVKIDTEGAELSLVDHEPSRLALARAKRVVLELHYFAATSATKQLVIESLDGWVNGFSDTHEVEWRERWTPPDGKDPIGALVDMRRK
jgi:FkbM family methyltransferase